jgi:Uma2 family endonuclease
MSALRLTVPETKLMSTTARYSLADYDRMIARGLFDHGTHRRVELIRGALREMNPLGSLHESIVDRFVEWSFENLPKRSVWVRVQSSLGLASLQSAPEPDVTWVARRNYRLHRPMGDDVKLLVEVADSSLEYDRTDKARLYAVARVADYWIVNAREECVEVMREPSSDGYQNVKKYLRDDQIVPLMFPQLTLPVAALFEEE